MSNGREMNLRLSNLEGNAVSEHPINVTLTNCFRLSSASRDVLASSSRLNVQNVNLIVHLYRF